MREEIIDWGFMTMWLTVVMFGLESITSTSVP